MTNNGHKILTGLDQIIQYIECGRPQFYNFIKMGLPATVINRRWYAHKDNIDRFFQTITNVRVKEIPEDAE
jgi:hypothetical protein